MTKDAAAGAYSTFEAMCGSWQGINGFRLMPSEPMRALPASAQLTTASAGQALSVAYTWQHPDDGPQDGLLVVSSPEHAQETVNAAWVDSWHQAPAIAMLHGIVTDGHVQLSYDYGNGWGWIISFEMGRERKLHVTMRNVIPEEHASREMPVGPYSVMATELERA